MSELCSYDPELVVGILGGAAGTNRDTFQLLADAQRDGARLALFGPQDQARGIYPSRWSATCAGWSTGSTRRRRPSGSTHAAIRAEGLAPLRPLEEDLRITEPALAPEA